MILLCLQFCFQFPLLGSYKLIDRLFDLKGGSCIVECSPPCS